MIIPICRWENRGPERLSGCTQLTQSVRGWSQVLNTCREESNLCPPTILGCPLSLHLGACAWIRFLSIIPAFLNHSNNTLGLSFVCISLLRPHGSSRCIPPNELRCFRKKVTRSGIRSPGFELSSAPSHLSTWVCHLKSSEKNALLWKVVPGVKWDSIHNRYVVKSRAAMQMLVIFLADALRLGPSFPLQNDTSSGSHGNW